ncbi:MAG: metabolite traffic protein EboE [Planctomycetes bacterium]|nr:metabolite traffic protein EboE [Planctomycetota bacterium]
MRFLGSDGRLLHLAYCTNVHPGEDLDSILAGLRDVSAALRAELRPTGELGIGLYLPSAAAREVEASAARFDDLRRELDRGGLYVATMNAFPFGAFHAARVKEEVFRPSWAEPARLEHTLRCARLLERLAPLDVQPCLSTHTGGWRPWGQEEGFGAAVRRGLESARRSLEGFSREILLALEPEPDSMLESTTELADFLVEERERRGGSLEAQRLAVCLDTCHAAVLFESADLVERALRGRARVAKLQLSSALELSEPGAAAAARRELASWREPRWFHQVRGQARDGAILGASDLPALLDAEPSAEWLACRAWRVHFHVPIFAETIGALATTRTTLVELFERAVRQDWTRVFEVETYTFDRLPADLRGGSGSGALTRCLERELRSAQAILERLGFRPGERSR